VSVLPELALGHLRYPLTDVPPQSNSPPGTVPGAGRACLHMDGEYVFTVKLRFSQLPIHLWHDYHHLMPSVDELLHNRLHGEPVAPVHGHHQQPACLGKARGQHQTHTQRKGGWETCRSHGTRVLQGILAAETLGSSH
ncbi:hypothetical protein U0070_001133, partial [Myodes glareolus]